MTLQPSYRVFRFIFYDYCSQTGNSLLDRNLLPFVVLYIRGHLLPASTIVKTGIQSLKIYRQKKTTEHLSRIFRLYNHLKSLITLVKVVGKVRQLLIVLVYSEKKIYCQTSMGKISKCSRIGDIRGSNTLNFRISNKFL